MTDQPIRLSRSDARRYADGLMRQVEAADAIGLRDDLTEAARFRLAGIRAVLTAGATVVNITGEAAKRVEAQPEAPAEVSFQTPPPLPEKAAPTPRKRATAKPAPVPVPAGVVFRDLPPTRNPRGEGPLRIVWPARLAALRARPGEWALVHTGSPSTASNIRRGEVSGATAGEFEATSRLHTDGSGKADVYARYMGPS